MEGEIKITRAYCTTVRGILKGVEALDRQDRQTMWFCFLDGAAILAESAQIFNPDRMQQFIRATIYTPLTATTICLCQCLKQVAIGSMALEYGSQRSVRSAFLSCADTLATQIGIPSIKDKANNDE